MLLKRNERGFTLIELMIVVAIIAILAAVAIPQYRKFQLKAKTSEAKANLDAIRTAEFAYAAENDVYVGANETPDNSPAAGQTQSWSTTAPSGFESIGFTPQGDVYYCYGVKVGSNMTRPTSYQSDWGEYNTQSVVDGAVNAIMYATADLDGDGSNYGQFFTDDERNAITDLNPGEY